MLQPCLQLGLGLLMSNSDSQVGDFSCLLTDLGLQCLDNSDGAVAVEAKAGDIVVFSSLTPHRTGPNLTEDTRKAYICQYGYDDAQVITREGEYLKQTNPQRQYRIL